MIHALGNSIPDLEAGVFVAWNAEVTGSVRLGADVSVWYAATLRGDVCGIEIGAGSNIQDASVVHVDVDTPCVVGRNVTVGHRVVLHGCRIGDGALIGIGSIVLNGAEIGEASIVGAGALVTQGKKFPPRSLILGSPAKLVRELTDQEVADILQNSRHYVELARQARETARQIG